MVARNHYVRPNTEYAVRFSDVLTAEDLARVVRWNRVSSFVLLKVAFFKKCFDHAGASWAWTGTSLFVWC